MSTTPTSTRGSGDIIRTADGSDTLYNRELDQHYHSIFGAVMESRHIFIEAGFLHASEKILRPERNPQSELTILEIGFGTGLNALMTLTESEKLGIRVHYTALEPYPVDENCWITLNYPAMFGSIDYHQVFSKFHLVEWEHHEPISNHFTILKLHKKLEDYLPPAGSFDIVYFDAFDPVAQPELWTAEIFRKLHHAMKPGGILVTYSVKGTIVRAMQAAGFKTEKLPGPPGKRHILRAKLISI
jgi:tRNA U34 5-methylaminomethyl-2-thiouridine-forming methyltransferase MnmC